MAPLEGNADVAGEDAVQARASGKAGSLAPGRRGGGLRPNLPMAASQRSHSGVVEASTTGRKGRGGGGHTAELSGARRPHGGGAKEQQWVCAAMSGW